MNYQEMTISQLAHECAKDWKNPYFGAVPYLNALKQIGSISDKYGVDDGRVLVRYFLGNATSWRGEVAKAVKAELKRRL